MFPSSFLTKLFVSVLYNCTLTPLNVCSFASLPPFEFSSIQAVPVIIPVPFATSLLFEPPLLLSPFGLSVPPPDWFSFASIICVISGVVAIVSANNSAVATFVIASASVLPSE